MGHGHRRHVSRLAAEYESRLDAELPTIPPIDLTGGELGSIDVGASIAAFADPPTFEERQAQLRERYEHRRQLVNGGAYADLLYGVSSATGEDPRWMVDGAFDPNANRVDARTLQREIRIQGSGHGGGGRRRTKPVPFDENRALQQRVADHLERVSRSYLPILQVKGLTVGEIAVLSARSEDFVAALLAAIHREVKFDGKIPELKPTVDQIGKPTRRFYVGVDPEVHRTFHFRPFRGASRAALVNAAHALDRARIARIDAGWTTSAA